MFITLLVVTFLVSLAVSLAVVAIFNKSIASILGRITSGEVSEAWAKYIRFTVVVVGVSGGVRLWDMERYISASPGKQPLILDHDRWVLEVYRTILGSLQGVAWLLLVFFLFALIAYVIVRAFELRRTSAAKA
jgi:hypothetical protein